MKRKVFILALTVLFIFPFLTPSSAAQRVLANVDTYIVTGIAASGNTIFFGDTEGNLTAVNTDTQTEIWKFKDGDSTPTGTPAIVDGNVIFAKVTGEIFCLKISDGSLVWRYIPPSGGSVNEGLNDGVAAGGGKVYAAFTTGELKAFDLKNGHVLWTYKSDQGLRTAPAYANGLVLLGGYNGLFSMIDAKTGKRVNGGGAGGAINTPVVSGGNVYYSAWDGSVHAVQIKDVIPLWDAKADEPITTPPVISGGMLVVGTASGKICALSEKDGSLLWQYDTEGGQVIVRPVVSNGMVLVGTGDNRLLALNAASGKLSNEQPDRYALNTDPAFGGNRLYLVSGQQIFSME
ncbi:MAG: PQQ-binding-like beta-propeller repeat protein [Synergistaceae bacterium]|nr:PQQ-binding-like beta-propeller repeat protein [Synergistaceae bacterium]